MNKLTEIIIELAAKVVLPLAERIQQRRERPRLDPELKKLSIEDAVQAARDDLEARRRKNRDNAH